MCPLESPNLQYMLLIKQLLKFLIPKQCRQTKVVLTSFEFSPGHQGNQAFSTGNVTAHEWSNKSHQTYSNNLCSLTSSKYYTSSVILRSARPEISGNAVAIRSSRSTIINFVSALSRLNNTLSVNNRD